MKGRKELNLTETKTKSKIFLFLNVFILCNPILDVLTSLSVRMNLPLTPGVIIRTLFMGLGVLYVLFARGYKHKKLCVTYVVAVTAYCGLFLLRMLSLGGIGFAVSNLPELVKTFYFVYITVAFYVAYRHIGYRVSDKILALVVFEYVAVIFIGFVTKTGFVAYTSGSGAIGWFYAGNEVSGIVSILTPLAALCSFRVLADGQGKKSPLPLKIFSVILLLLCCFGACYVGTKVAFLAVVAYFGCCAVWGLIALISHKSRSNAVVAAVSVLLCIIMVGGYFVSPLKANIDNVMMPSIDKIQSDPTDKPDEEKNPPSGTVIYPELQATKAYKLVNTVMSNRIYFALPTVKAFIEGSAADKLLGLGYRNLPSSEDNIEKAIEIDLLSVICRHGIAGTVLIYVPLVVLFAYILICFLKRIKESFASLSCCTYLYALAMGLAISTFTGHTLVAPAVSIYVAILFVNMIIREKNEALLSEEMTALSE